MEMSLELVPHDGVDICMGATICLPPICYHTKELVRGKKNLLVIRALDDHKLLLNSLKPIFSLHGGTWLVRRWWGEFAGTPPNETGVVVEVLVAGELVGWAAYY
jgi:hypothetical protein